MKKATKKAPLQPGADKPNPNLIANLVAKEGCCEEASMMSSSFYIPCNAPAVSVVYSDRDKREYRMCEACAHHNVKNRGAVLRGKYKGPKPTGKTTDAPTTPTGRVPRGPNMQGISHATPEAKAIRDAYTKPRDPVSEIHQSRTLPVPASLLLEVDSSRALFETLIALTEHYIPRLAADMGAANKKSTISLARAYVVLYKLNEAVEVFDKAFTALFEKFKKEVIPQAFEQAGIPSIPLDEGMRVGTSHRTFASIKPGSKEAAYDWLRANYPDIIQPTVNSSTLSALAKSLQEEDNKELPENLFNVALVPTTSVTVTKK